ncbi:MAG: uracil-DNA glycosylase family protein [Muribaculaceae bacterium]|nr:uracil-DNA glycosylase family protein [Muribaculaceae bacterium]
MPTFVKSAGEKKILPIETHPWPPFVPDGARLLIMGTFPPSPKRWSMDFYYPNPTNDFWRIAGLVFLGDSMALYDAAARRFRPDDVKALMTEHHIAMSDTCHRIRRLQGNASDKFLEVVEPVHLENLLARMPHCNDIATTGEKAASVMAELTCSEPPRMGEYVECEAFGRHLRVWRMPSTSRAYPLRLELKAEYYRKLWEASGCM